jgi:hypothetical protein
MVISIKNYKTAQGLSKKIHDDAKFERIMRVKGPMGKGF